MEWISNSEEESYQLAFRLGQEAKKGEIYCLEGDLGVGKTVFAKGFAKGPGGFGKCRFSHLYHREGISGERKALSFRPLPYRRSGGALGNRLSGHAFRGRHRFNGMGQPGQGGYPSGSQMDLY